MPTLQSDSPVLGSPAIFALPIAPLAVRYYRGGGSLAVVTLWWGVITAFFELLELVFGRLIDRLLPRRHITPGVLKSAELPSPVAEEVIAALKAGQDPAGLLPPGWRSYQTGLDQQAEPEIVARVPVGTSLVLSAERDEGRNRDRVRVGDLGYLPSVDELTGPLRRGWVRCWLAERRPTGRYPDGAVILFVAVYDPR